MAIWKSVEFVEVTLDATLEPVTVNLSKSQDETKCVPWVTSRAAGTLTDQHQDRMVHVEIIDNAGTPAVRCTASARVDNDDSLIKIFIVEFDSSINVQQLAFTMTGTSTTVSPASVGADINEAFVVASYEYTSPPASDDDWNDALVRLVLTTTTNVNVSRNGSGGTIEGTVYVVDCDSDEWFTHHHDESFVATTTTIRTKNIDFSPTVVMADCFTLHSYETDEATDDMKDAIWSAHLESTTEVQFERNQGATSNSNSSEHTLQIVECANNEYDVQRNTTFLSSGASAITNQSITAVDRTRSVAHHCSGCAGDTVRPPTNSSTSGNDAFLMIQSAILSADDNLQFERNGTGFSASRIYWEVIQFAEAIITASGGGTIAPVEAAGTATVRKTASGTPSITAIVAAGAAIILNIASGGGSLAPVEASGAAQVIKAASGTPSIAPIEAAGTALIINTAAGSPSIAAIESAGTVDLIRNANGAPSIAAIEAAGTALIIKTASGSPAITAIEAAGTADVLGSKTASGDGPVPAITASGNALVKKSASGTPSITAIVASGAALVNNIASGGATLAPVEAAGTSIIVKTASGSPSLAAVTATGTALIINTASGSPSIPAIEAAGTADVLGTITASGDGPVPAIDSSGAALVKKLASGTPSIPVIDASGTAQILKSASGAPSIAPIEAAGIATIINTASGAASLTPITASGVSVIRKIASGSANVPTIQSAGTATILNIASGNGPVPSIVAAGTATILKLASGAASITAITASGDARVGGVVVVTSAALEGRQITVEIIGRIIDRAFTGIVK